MRLNLSEDTIAAYNKRASYYENKWENYLDHTHNEFLRRIITDKGDRILDISGGTGLLAKILIRKEIPFSHYIINDPSSQMLSIARNRFSNVKRVSFTNYKAEGLDFNSNQFDQIFCLNSFHFYQGQSKILEKLYTLLKPGGRLQILDWNRSGHFIGVNRLLKWLTSDYIDTLSHQEIQTMLSDTGFKTQNTDHWNWWYWKFFYIVGVK